eukprot:2144600-Alexandrium_andersonii.AAC.1
MSAKSQQFGIHRNTGRLLMAEMPPDGGQTPCTEALQSLLGAASRLAPYYRRERSDRATCPTLLCEIVFA